MKRLPVIPHCVILVAMAAWFARLPTTDKCPPFTLGWEGKYTAQLFEHLGFEVAGEWYVVGEFHNGNELNTMGRLGDIRGRPNEEDLAKVRHEVSKLVRAVSARSART